MLKATIVRIVEFCTRHTWSIILTAVALAVVSVIYAAMHFQITTDITQLISSDLPWRKREIEILKMFPQRELSIVAVVQAQTPEYAGEATNQLTQKLTGRTDLFHSVNQLGGGPFFDRNGMLYLPKAEVERLTGHLADSEPILGALAGDPSLRGALDALSFGILGVQGGTLKLDNFDQPLTRVSDRLDAVLAGRPATFSWREMAANKPSELRDLRRFIEVVPVLDFSALEPGRAAEEAIRQAAVELKLAENFGATVRLTGPIAMADDEVATVKDGALVNNLVTITSVLIILWLALRSGRIILAVFISLMVGLAITAAFGLFLIGAYNLISIAFAVLFVGIGVDFGIQFSVRYRAERHAHS